MQELKGKIITIDTETNGLDKMQSQPFMITIAILGGEPFDLRPDETTIQYLTQELPKADIVGAHNAKFDAHMLINAGVPMQAIRNTNFFCTAVAETLIDEHLGDYSLDACANRRFGLHKKGDYLYKIAADKFGGPATRKAQIGNIWKLDYEQVLEYALYDPKLTNDLMTEQIDDLTKQNLNEVMQLEMQTLKALIAIERRGVPVAVDRLDAVKDQINTRQEELRQAIIDIAGWDVNIRSGKQLKQCFDEIGIKYKTSKAGNGVFNKQAMEQVRHPIGEIIIERRGLFTLVSNFLNTLPNHIGFDGRIHSNFNQTRTEYGTRTGRLSSSGPNLQQVPSYKRHRTEIVRQFRKAFREEGLTWISGDWEQFEFRIFGNFAAKDAVINMYRDDPSLDYHAVVAKLANIRRSPEAKQLNLGLIFGMGETKMARHLGVTQAKARKIFAAYHKALPMVKPFLKKAEKIAKQRGFLFTKTGRRIRIPDPEKAYKAGGLFFQATAADIMKQKLVEFENFFGNGSCQLILPVHDEFDFLCSDDPEPHCAEIKAIMEDVPQLKIPILADIISGQSWAGKD